MPRKFGVPRLLAVLVLFGALVGVLVFAAVGDDDGDTPSRDQTPVSTRDRSDRKGKGGGFGRPARDTDDDFKAPAGAAKAALDSCKQSIRTQSTLSQGLQKDLIGICSKAVRGNDQDVRDAAEEVCTKIIQETVPQAVQTKALAACANPNGGG